MGNLSNEMENIKTIKRDKGVQYLINEAAKIFDNPILMYDLDYKAIAYTENIVTDDPLWNEFVKIGGYSSESIELFKDECFIDVEANTKTIAILSSDKLKYDRIFGKIYNKNNITVAGVNLVACNKPLDDDVSAIFEAFCKILSKEVSKDGFYQTYGESYQENLIGKLIDGNIEDKRLYPLRMDIIYSGLKNYLYLAVVDVVRCDPEYTKLLYFRDLLRQTQPKFKYAIYSNYIIIIISSNSMKLNIKKDLKKFNGLFEQNNVYAGISSCFENLYEFQKYYIEAVNALNYGLTKDNSSQRICLYDEIKESVPE